MGRIIYTANNRFFVKTDNGAGANDYDAQMIVKYFNNMKNIRQKNEWKTIGSGARFMNTYRPGNLEYLENSASINGVSACGGELIYSAFLGGIGGLYRKTLEKTADEGNIMSSNDIQVYKLSVFGGNCAASVGGGEQLLENCQMANNLVELDG